MTVNELIKELQLCKGDDTLFLVDENNRVRWVNRIYCRRKRGAPLAGTLLLMKIYSSEMTDGEAWFWSRKWGKNRKIDISDWRKR